MLVKNKVGRPAGEEAGAHVGDLAVWEQQQ